MLDADFWWEQAKTFSARAEITDDALLKSELLELAAICESVAAKIAQHAPGG